MSSVTTGAVALSLFNTRAREWTQVSSRGKYSGATAAVAASGYVYAHLTSGTVGTGRQVLLRINPLDPKLDAQGSAVLTLPQPTTGQESPSSLEMDLVSGRFHETRVSLAWG